MILLKPSNNLLTSIPLDVMTLSGMTVQVSGSWDAVSNSVHVTHLIVKGGGSMQAQGSATNTNISSVLFLVSLCGNQPKVSPSDILASWTNGNGKPTYGRTMQDYYNECSFGKVIVI
jgi:hypothetical protein